MDLNIPMFSGISLKIANDTSDANAYPTSRLRKGLVLVYNGQELVEEGVGFGVPVLKQGLRTIFPGDLELNSLHINSVQKIVATYTINLEEKLTRQNIGVVNSKTLYATKNLLARLYMRFPPWRGLLIAVSKGLRRIFSWETTYEEIGWNIKVKVIYTVESQRGAINVEVDASGLLESGITEVVLMNEQGARHFDLYQDSNGITLRGEAIGSWGEVTAEEASFICSSLRLAFTLHAIKGARLFRGRELMDNRLAWAGFGYSFHPKIRRIDYTMRIERLP